MNTRAQVETTESEDALGRIRRSVQRLAQRIRLLARRAARAIDRAWPMCMLPHWKPVALPHPDRRRRRG